MSLWKYRTRTLFPPFDLYIQSDVPPVVIMQLFCGEGWGADANITTYEETGYVTATRENEFRFGLKRVKQKEAQNIGGKLGLLPNGVLNISVDDAQWDLERVIQAVFDAGRHFAGDYLLTEHFYDTILLRQAWTLILNERFWGERHEMRQRLITNFYEMFELPDLYGQDDDLMIVSAMLGVGFPVDSTSAPLFDSVDWATIDFNIGDLLVTRPFGDIGDRKGTSTTDMLSDFDDTQPHDD